MMKNFFTAFFVVFALMPFKVMADEVVYVENFIEADGGYYSATIYRSDDYPDLEFVDYGDKGMFARVNTEAPYEVTYVSVPYEVTINEGYYYNVDESGNKVLQTYTDSDGKEQVIQPYYGTIEIKGVDFCNNSSLESFEMESGLEWVRCYNCTGLKAVLLSNTITDLSKSCWEGDGGYHMPYPTPSEDYDESTDYVRAHYYGSFMGCSSLERIYIPFSVQKIEGAFIDCTSLRYATFEKDEWDEQTQSQFTSMDYAFFGCSSLEEIEVPSGVSSLVATFQDCTSLYYIDIPSSVTDLGGAFMGCTSLQNTNFLSGKSNVKWMFETFLGCTSLTSAIVPEGVTTIEEAFKDCTNLKSVTIFSESLTNVRDAFRECRNLVAVAAMDNGEMNSYEDVVYIPHTVTQMRYAFLGCYSLRQVKFSENCDLTVGKSQSGSDSDLFNPGAAGGAFQSCLNLASVVLPTNLNRLDASMFIGSSIGEITIPSSVTDILSYVFNGCSALKKITFTNATPPYVSKYAFMNAEQEKTAYVPKESVALYEVAFKACNEYNAAKGYGLVKVVASDSVPVVAGDVNGDGIVAVDDITEIVNLILGGVLSGEYSLTNADVNNDGQVTIADVTALVNIILGKMAE
ncbi:MAG: leucine-rich repeat protein [Prevotella sp.]|nr:leucine-rich repeat protein [Prevotella sp.]